LCAIAAQAGQEVRPELVRAPADEPGPLHWTGELAESLAPTGRRLFAGRLEPVLGFGGALGYGDRAHGPRDPMLLELRVDGQRLELERTRVEGFPTHQLVHWTGPGLELLERKYVTEDDELVDELELVSTAQGPLDLELSLWGAQTPGIARLGSELWPFALAETANLPPSLERELGLVAPEAGGMTYDGVRFTFARGASADAPAFVALRGGAPGQAGRDLPLELSLEAPEVAPAIATYHLLVAAPAPGGRLEGETAALVRFHFADGTSETLPWPSIGARLAGGTAGAAQGGLAARSWWHLLLLPGSGEPALRLSYVPPPGRFVRRLQLEKGEGTAFPVLLAATAEVPPPSGRPPAHVGRTEFLGVGVHWALAGQDFVPTRDARGRRRLLRALHLEPGASARVRAVLVTGPRPAMTVLRALDRVGDDGTFERHRAAQADWVEREVPGFRCSDADLELAWELHWHLVRRSMMRLDLPEFSLPVFYLGLEEGQDSIGLASTGRALAQLRWLRDLRFAQGQLRALCKAQRPGQRLTGLGPGRREGVEPHGIAAAALGVYEVTASRPFLSEVWPSLVADFDATWDQAEPPRDPGQGAVRSGQARVLARGLGWLGLEEQAARLVALTGPEDPSDPMAPEEALEDWIRAARRDGGDPQARAHLSAELLARARAHRTAQGPAPPPAAGDPSQEGTALDSGFVDLLVRSVAGVVPAHGDVGELWPLVTELEHFRFEGLPYHGHELDVSWDRPDGVVVHGEEPEGFSARLDGQLLFRRPSLERVRVALPARR